jgi:hypothetical protein
VTIDSANRTHKNQKQNRKQNKITETKLARLGLCRTYYNLFLLLLRINNIEGHNQRFGANWKMFAL